MPQCECCKQISAASQHTTRAAPTRISNTHDHIPQLIRGQALHTHRTPQVPSTNK